MLTPLAPPKTPSGRWWLAVLDKYRLSLGTAQTENHSAWWQEQGDDDDFEKQDDLICYIIWRVGGGIL